MNREDVTSTRSGDEGRTGRRAPSRSRRTARLGVGGCALLVGLIGWAAPAAAHVTITPSTTAAGAYAILEVSVGHGCEDSPTTEVTIQIPPGINSVTPTRTALWEVEKQVERLDPPVADSHGNQVEERVASVTYRTDTPLPNGYRDTFELSVQLPDDEGGTLVFPTIQTCEQGESAWIEVAQDGQDTDELELPAPSFVISAAGEGGHGDVTTTATTDDSESEDRPVAAPASDGADALTIAALVAGLLGSVLGGAALVRQRRRP
jgi:uncharacterized protein YcnI